MPLLRSRLWLWICLGLAAAVACTTVTGERARSGGLHIPPPLPPSPGTAWAAASSVHLPVVMPEEHPGLHHVFELSSSIISGGEPQGPEAFEILQRKGVRTILSVDGKVPDAAMAAKYGMRYVHVPIQYKCITDEEIAKIAKTFRELPGPFYVHCFHGKHRGPAAAALGRLVLDGVSREEAIAEMRQWCGTSKRYEGLYDTIAHSEIPGPSETRALAFDFPAAQPLEGLPGAMIKMARVNDHLKVLSSSGWQPDPRHPDLDPLNEAAKLADLLERASALSTLEDYPQEFHRWLRDAMAQSGTLRDTVAAVRAGAATARDADRIFEALGRTCTTCHETYRNR